MCYVITYQYHHNCRNPKILQGNRSCLQFAILFPLAGPLHQLPAISWPRILWKASASPSIGFGLSQRTEPVNTSGVPRAGLRLGDNLSERVPSSLIKMRMHFPLHPSSPRRDKKRQGELLIISPVPTHINLQRKGRSSVASRFEAKGARATVAVVIRAMKEG